MLTKPMWHLMYENVMISVSGFWRERVCLNVWIKVFYNRHRVMIARRVFILAYDGRLRSVQCYFINSRLFFSPYFLTSSLISNLQPLEISFNTISQIIKLLQIKKTLHAAEYLTYSSLMFFFYREFISINWQGFFIQCRVQIYCMTFCLADELDRNCFVI